MFQKSHITAVRVIKEFLKIIRGAKLALDGSLCNDVAASIGFQRNQSRKKVFFSLARARAFPWKFAPQ